MRWQRWKGKLKDKGKGKATKSAGKGKDNKVKEKHTAVNETLKPTIQVQPGVLTRSRKRQEQAALFRQKVRPTLELPTMAEAAGDNNKQQKQQQHQLLVS